MDTEGPCIQRASCKLCADYPQVVEGSTVVTNDSPKQLCQFTLLPIRVVPLTSRHLILSAF